MSDEHDEIERIARDALHARADQVEPSPDAYARLADKVTGAARRPARWWLCCGISKACRSNRPG